MTDTLTDGTDDGVVDSAEGLPSLDSILDEARAELGDASDGSTEGAEGTEAASEGQTDEQKYTVKVNGQDVEVSLDELIGGYSRTSDYTQKTQALAAERERLAAFDALDKAIASDPEGTLRGLAQAMGVDLFGQISPEVDESLDPEDPTQRMLLDVQRELNDLKRYRHESEAAARQQAIDRDLETVKVKYKAPELDEAALLDFALKHQIGDLDAAYRAMKFDELQSQQSDTSAASKLENKRTAPPVEGGGNRNVGVVQGVSDKPSLDEAWALAVKELRSGNL